MEAAAVKKGVNLKAHSVEKATGSGDLVEVEPYLQDRRPAPGMPGPVTSRQEQYGLATNSSEQQAECDRGTIMAARSIDIAWEVAKTKTNARIPRVSTLGNPPPTMGDSERLSAWELPEMDHSSCNRGSQHLRLRKRHRGGQEDLQAANVCRLTLGSQHP